MKKGYFNLLKGLKWSKSIWSVKRSDADLERSSETGLDYKKGQLIIAVVLMMMFKGAGDAWQALAETAVETTITILHTNDLHGRVEEGIGFARLSTLVRDFREENPNILLLDAGDTVHGLPIATLFQGESIIRLMNAVGYDAMVAGNHDFNYGWQRLVDLDEMADFPIMGANLVNDDGFHILTPYLIEELDGVSIGIFALSTPETAFKTHPKNVAGLTFLDPVEVATEMVAFLEPQVDLIIALGHLGTDAESEPYTSTRVIQAVDGIDILIDGHCHTAFPEGLLVNQTLLVSTGEHGNHLGVVQLTIKNNELITAEASLIRAAAVDVEEDATVAALIRQLNQEVQAIGAEIIGSTSVRLDGERDLVRTSETNFGNLVADVFLEVTGADVALINSGGIRDSIEAGIITKGDLTRVFPFGNSIEVKRVTGQVIKDALEHGTSVFPEPSGAFPQVAGMTFVIDLFRPEGDRIVDILVGKEPLDLTAEYSLATNDFVAASGDGYEMIGSSLTLLQMMTMDEALIDYISEQGYISPIVEGRIRVRNGEDDPKPGPIEPELTDPKPEPIALEPTDPKPGPIEPELTDPKTEPIVLEPTNPKPDPKRTPQPETELETGSIQIRPISSTYLSEERLLETGQSGTNILPVLGVILLVIGLIAYFKRKQQK